MEEGRPTPPMSDDEDWFFDFDVLEFFLILAFFDNSKRGGRKNHDGDVECFREVSPVYPEFVFYKHLYPVNKG